MKLICTYNSLVSNLADVAGVVEDQMLNDDMKNAIFKLESKDGLSKVTLIGATQLITFRRELDANDFRLEFTEEEQATGVVFFQIKSKELNGFLNSYKSSRRTTVEEVTFTFTERGKILCQVLEKDKTEDERPYLSNWVFNNIPIKENMMPMINLVGADKTVALNKANILLPTKTLLNVLTNVTSLYGQMIVGEDYAVAFNPAFVTLMNNTMREGGVFENIKLSYKALSFMDKVICTEDVVEVAKSEQHIYFKTSNSEAFVRYDTKLADYATYMDIFKKDYAVCVDRIFLKDILKRLSLVNEAIEVTIKPEENTVEFKNTKFQQEIPIIQQKDIAQFGTLTFKIMPDVLDKAIIGTDEEFGSYTFIYYCPQQGGKASIVFADDLTCWYSVVKVNILQKNSL